jgi:hypothetical protein
MTEETIVSIQPEEKNPEYIYDGKPDGKDGKPDGKDGKDGKDGHHDGKPDGKDGKDGKPDGKDGKDGKDGHHDGKPDGKDGKDGKPDGKDGKDGKDGHHDGKPDGKDGKDGKPDGKDGKDGKDGHHDGKPDGKDGKDGKPDGKDGKDGHGHHHKDGSVPPAGMRDGHGHHHKDDGRGHHHNGHGAHDRPVNEGIVATLDLQFLPVFNVEEDFVIVNKEIFTALESEEGDGFSKEDEFTVVDEGAPDDTGAVFVFKTHNNTLYYDANGSERGFGDEGGAIIEIAKLVGDADGLTVQDFFLIDDGVPSEGITATLDLQSLEEFNIEEDFVVLSKEIFTALESEEGDGFSKEDEFAVVNEDAPDDTGAVFVFKAENNTLYYDANGTELGFGEEGGAIIEIAEITGTPDPDATLSPADFFVIM